MTDDITVLQVDNGTVTGPTRQPIRHRQDDIAIRVANDANDALSHLESSDDIDCVVCECGVRANGRNLLDAIRDRWPTLPVILFIDRENESVASETITADATDQRRNRSAPPQYWELTDRIRTVVDRCRSEMETRRVSYRDRVQFELLVDTVEDHAIFLLDETGCVQTWNTGAEKINGYTSEEIVGEHVSVFYTDADVEAGVPERCLREAAAEGRARDEGWRIRKDGSKYRADATIVALHDGEDVVGYAKITRDVTSRHRERILRERNQQLKEHIATLTHDLRNPLTVAKGNVEVALETGDCSNLDASKRGLDRIEELLDSVMSLAQQDGQVVTPESIELRELAEDAWNVVPTGDATLTVEGSATVVADRGKLQQLLENLFKNAVDHGGPTPTVRIGRFDEGFYVEDDGPGIPTADRTAVFEMGHSTDPDGTGVGLAVCDRIVDIHGWDIDVRTSGSGGARFEVSGPGIV